MLAVRKVIVFFFFTISHLPFVVEEGLVIGTGVTLGFSKERT